MGRKNASSDKQQHELEELIASYEAAQKENKKLYLDADLLADIADEYISGQRFDDAQEVINYGLELHPGNTDLLIVQGYLYLDLSELQKAKQVACSITETYNPEVTLLKAEILLTEGKLDEADALLESIEDKDSLNVVVGISELLLSMGYSQKALPWLTEPKIMERYKEDYDFLTTLAECYRCCGQFYEAIPIFNKLIDMNPYSPYNWTCLAKCYFVMEEYEKTVEACDFALAADENYGDAHSMKGHSLFYLGNEEEAIREYRLGIETKNMPPEMGLMFIGLAYANMENWEMSHTSYQQALDAIGDNDSAFLSDIYSNEAYNLAKLNRYEEAHLLCRKALEKLPDDPDIYLTEGRIYALEKNYDAAKDSWILALRYSPDVETLTQIGGYCMDFGLSNTARAIFERVRKINPDYPDINERLASICLMLRDHKGFFKYNRLAENPITIEALRRPCPSDTDEDTINIITDFIDKYEEYFLEMNGKDSNELDDDDEFESYDDDEFEFPDESEEEDDEDYDDEDYDDEEDFDFDDDGDFDDEDDEEDFDDEDDEDDEEDFDEDDDYKSDIKN